MTTFLYIIIFILLILILSAWRQRVNHKKKLRKYVHDLRTRLAIIKTNTEITLMNPETGEKIKEMLKSNIEEVNAACVILDKIIA